MSAIFYSTRNPTTDINPWYCEAGEHRCHFNISGQFATHCHEMVYSPRPGTIIDRAHGDNPILIEFRDDLEAIAADSDEDRVRMIRYLVASHLFALEGITDERPEYAHAEKVLRRYEAALLS